MSERLPIVFLILDSYVMLVPHPSKTIGICSDWTTILGGLFDLTFLFTVSWHKIKPLFQAIILFICILYTETVEWLAYTSCRLIQECWDRNPWVRPTFSAVIVRLDRIRPLCVKESFWKGTFKFPRFETV
jgi:hypothetical protein